MKSLHSAPIYIGAPVGMTNSRTLLIYVATFFLIRALSFFLRLSPLLQGIIAGTILITFVWAFFKHPRLAWQLLLAELLLDGSGHFFELHGIALRTLLLVVTLSLWYGFRQKETKQIIANLPRGITHALMFLFGVVAFASVWGYLRGHTVHAIFPYAIPYAFFLLLIPAIDFAKDEQNQIFFRQALTASLLGSAIFSLFTFAIFSTHVAVLQDPYYHWFRDAASGKITDVGDNFFRIVLPDHLLIPLIMIVLASLLMAPPKADQPRAEKNKKLYWLLLATGSLILSLNLSRTYFLAFGIGLLLLYAKSRWKQWLRVSLVSVFFILAFFSLVHLAASGGTALGWELLGLRFGSIAHPADEVSAYTRQALLAPIFHLIVQHPIIGSGLGSTITLYSPTTNSVVTTNQFDWGYLQIWAELGVLGIVSWLALIMAINRLVVDEQKNSQLMSGLHANLIALLFMTITTPALFHVFGILFLISVIVASKKNLKHLLYE